MLSKVSGLKGRKALLSNSSNTLTLDDLALAEGEFKRVAAAHAAVEHLAVFASPARVCG